MLALEAEHAPRQCVADTAVLAADPLANIALYFPCLREGRIESGLRVRRAVLGTLSVCDRFTACLNALRSSSTASTRSSSTCCRAWPSSMFAHALTQLLDQLGERLLRSLMPRVSEHDVRRFAVEDPHTNSVNCSCA